MIDERLEGEEPPRHRKRAKRVHVRSDHRHEYELAYGRYVPDKGTCKVECFDDGVDEGVDGEWFAYATATWYLSCGHEVYGSERPCYCSTCGRKVKED